MTSLFSQSDRPAFTRALVARYRPGRSVSNMSDSTELPCVQVPVDSVHFLPVSFRAMAGCMFFFSFPNREFKPSSRRTLTRAPRSKFQVSSFFFHA
jgi:hypothetical protein